MKSSKNIFRCIIILIISGILLNGCLTKQKTEKPVIKSQKDSKNTVQIVDFEFQPGELTVKQGTKVTWVNKGQADHTVTAEKGQFESGNLSNGQSFSFTFNEKGNYDYNCSNHPQMAGKIIVN